MNERKTDPIRPTDDAARALARKLIDNATFGALAVIDKNTEAPMVSRVAIGTTQQGTPLTFISSLSQHTAALRATPACSLLLGEPGNTGDPLTHPRITLQCTAEFIAPTDPDRGSLRQKWLAGHPKSKLYIDFADFSFVVLTIRQAFLNGGFGKAFRLSPDDLGQQAR